MQTYSFCSIVAENSMPGFSILTYRSAEALDDHPPTALSFCWFNPATAPAVAPPILPVENADLQLLQHHGEELDAFPSFPSIPSLQAFQAFQAFQSIQT